MKADSTLSIPEIAVQIEASTFTVWKILRKKLKVYPYKSHNVAPLDDTHRLRRIEFCHWILGQTAEFLDSVIWSDEKYFEEKFRSNRQNERYWGYCDPCVLDENRVQGGKKVMCWAALIDGKVVIHFFPVGQTLNQHVYLDMLKTVLWPKVRGLVTRRSYWFQ